MNRTPEMSARYGEWKIKTRANYGTIGTLRLQVMFQSRSLMLSLSERYLLDVVLPRQFVNLTTAPIGEDEWVHASDLDANTLLTGEKGMCLLKNDWPYNVPQGVTHSCLWTRVSPYHSLAGDRCLRKLILHRCCQIPRNPSFMNRRSTTTRMSGPKFNIAGTRG